jgi:hypothetical protein
MSLPCQELPFIEVLSGDEFESLSLLLALTRLTGTPTPHVELPREVPQNTLVVLSIQ